MIKVANSYPAGRPAGFSDQQLLQRSDIMRDISYQVEARCVKTTTPHASLSLSLTSLSSPPRGPFDLRRSLRLATLRLASCGLHFAACTSRLALRGLIARRYLSFLSPWAETNGLSLDFQPTARAEGIWFPKPLSAVISNRSPCLPKPVSSMESAKPSSPRARLLVEGHM